MSEYFLPIATIIIIVLATIVPIMVISMQKDTTKKRKEKLTNAAIIYGCLTIIMLFIMLGTNIVFNLGSYRFIYILALFLCFVSCIASSISLA